MAQIKTDEKFMRDLLDHVPSLTPEQREDVLNEYRLRAELITAFVTALTGKKPA